jgi:predicted alpha/beta hydrolase
LYTPPVTVTRVQFPALDGYSLGGFLHLGTNADPHHAVVFATGGGIRADVYRHFLSYLASQGMAVLAFDYRGIGESRPSRLRGFVAGFEDWAEYDAGGAIAWMAGRYPRACLTGIGHSIGALMIGASAAAARLSQLVLICPHTGYHGDYHPVLRLGVRVSWGVLGPPLRRMLGYFPASKLGFGEDLPTRVALQWAGRSQPHFVIGLDDGNAAREQLVLDQVKQLRKPAMVISIDDDRWATETGVRRILQVYRNLLIVRRVIDPSADYKRPLGHFGFFRRSQKDRLWPLVLRFVASDSIASTSNDPSKVNA